MDTIFHKILRREVPATIVHEDEDVLVFHDIRPRAPLHLLFIPKLFAQSILTLDATTRHLPGMLILKAKDFAASHDVPGYTLTFHCGADGGQEVPYLHLHFLAEKTISCVRRRRPPLRLRRRRGGPP